ncbi:MAG: hypothetical protein AB200_02300 [Parcubacteria bacterium C7867-005]|nr:MAG: hypothetical protein AB200_02300 [Parcubacteria bacterium C7867-005]
MNKKIIFLTLLAVIILIVGGWFIFGRQLPQQSDTETESELPFGQGGSDIPFNPSNPGDKTTSTNPSNNQTGATFPNFFKLSLEPVAGAISIIKNGSTVVRYVDRATGHVYDIKPDTQERMKITNNTLPKIYEAIFRSDGNALVLRSLEGDQISNLSIALTAPKSTTTDALHSVTMTPLRGEIKNISGGTKLFYVLADTKTLISSEFDGTKQKNLGSYPFSEWTPFTSEGTSLFIQTRPDSSTPGYAYTVNQSSGKATKILGPLNGLTILPNKTGKSIIYSYYSGDEFVLEHKNFDTNKNTKIFPVTIPEKCVWSKKENLIYCGNPEGIVGPKQPESWYQGAVSFNDSIWKIDPANQLSDVLLEPRRSFEVDVDVINPFLSPDEDYLFFINKKDLSLWALKLK